MTRRGACICALLGVALVSAAGPSMGAGHSEGTIPSLGGGTGLINIPVAAVLPDATYRFGYAHIDRHWVYQLRPTMANKIYYLGIGFLPRTEIVLRSTIFPDERLLAGVGEPNEDRMASIRFLVLREARWPAVAVGVDDIHGTRRFHSLYAVASKRLPDMPAGVGLTLTAGYGSDLLRANNYVLLGWFGGLDLRPVPWLSVVLEQDTEKWNTAARFLFLDQLSLSAAFLNLDSFSAGVGWTRRF